MSFLVISRGDCLIIEEPEIIVGPGTVGAVQPGSLQYPDRLPRRGVVPVGDELEPRVVSDWPPNDSDAHDAAPGCRGWPATSASQGLLSGVRRGLPSAAEGSQGLVFIRDLVVISRFQAERRPVEPIKQTAELVRHHSGLPPHPASREELVSQADGTASLLPPAGPQAQGWTGKCKSGHCQCFAEIGVFILSPSARPGPSRLGPAGEGRSDSGVLHLHLRGQARYSEVADGERMNPQGKAGAFAPMQVTTSTRATKPGPARDTRGFRPAPHSYELAVPLDD